MPQPKNKKSQILHICTVQTKRLRSSFRRTLSAHAFPPSFFILNRTKHEASGATQVDHRSLIGLNRLGSAGGGSIGSLTVLVLVLGVLGLFVRFQVEIKDWLALRGYQPPAYIAQLADQGTMTPYGRKVFYVNRPEMNQKDEFVKNCPDSSKELTIVLGCYHSGQSGIYLLDVDDARLEGVEQVTAAHEMLHAAYERLSGAEREKVDAMLMDFYANKLSDERIKTTIDAYRDTIPDDLVNEMHSIFATEVADLPAELEEYYKEYFESRKVVVAMSERYQAEFTSRQQAVKNYDSRLAVLKTQIDSAKADIDVLGSEIESRKATLDRHRSSNNTEAFNAGVPAFNNLVERYNFTIQQTKALIDEFNALVEKRNAIAVEQDQLVEELKGNADAIQE